MSIIEDVVWADVRREGDGLLVVAGELEGDDVVVWRWQGDLLDSEVAARRLLATAGISQQEMLGHGPGWMVLEALGEGLWRTVHSSDLDHPELWRRLGRWIAAAHRVPAEGLGPDPLWSLLDAPLLGLVAQAIGSLGGLTARVTAWQDELARLPQVVCLGGLDEERIEVVGQVVDARPGDLSRCHRGAAVQDLVVLERQLTPGQWQLLAAGHGLDGFDDPQEQPGWRAAAGLVCVLDLAAAVLSGKDPAPALNRLDGLVHGG
ncbi:hypothetical protein [Luteococcus sp.]|uniref:hypothetical protein n=1 Tax=Luteococcus sp. TaxID=1969402 RepID=UPI003736D836